MSFFSEIASKPWTDEQIKVDDQFKGHTFTLPKAMLGLRVLLVVVTMFFTLLAIAYSGRMTFEDWQSLPEPGLLWFNTGLLLVSSVVFRWTKSATQQGRNGKVKLGLFLVGALAFAFLIGQLIVWQQLADLGHFASANPANGFFYLITGLHGLHLLGGLVAWGRTTLRVMRGKIGQEKLLLSVEMCALYWSFLLVVWLAMFLLLLVT
ncbi:MAG: cytochrome c oxidase subunit 3 [Sneathiella sp.]|nr:cytochrome c oxidase subunit 3 [Sneathiella sp.]